MLIITMGFYFLFIGQGGNMEEYYLIYKFIYKAKGDLNLCIIARNEEIANKILYWINLDRNEEELYIPKRFRFRRKMLIDIEPYRIEQEQLETAEERYNNRCEYRKKHKEI